MKKGLFVVFLISVFAHIADAQTTKVGVLVIGNGSNAIGAGFQSAVSGVKTIILPQEPGFMVSLSEKNISSGIEAEFLKRMRVSKGIQDSTAKVYIDGTSANAILKTWADSIKNLTVVRGVKWSRIKRSGNNWNILLADGRTIKAEVIVNADGTGNVNQAMGLSATEGKLWQPFGYKDNRYRISVGSGYEMNHTSANFIPLFNFLIPEQENLVVLDKQYESFAAGQAGGAIAAYAVFFRTKTSLSAIKPIQKELINYRLAVIPFADINQGDPNWSPIQYIGLSGFLKAVFVNGEAKFMPDQIVSTAEVKEPIKEFYYKAQIWFDDYKAEKMTLGAVLDMVSVVGNKAPESTRNEVKKKWEKQYHFRSEFDLKREINRREFAVLVDEYLNQFKVDVDKNGRVIR